MKKFKKTTKKVLSLLLAVFMIVGTVELGFGGLLTLKAEAASNKVSIAVPETIYLTPAASATTFQYYLNNTAAGAKYNYVTSDGFDNYDNAGYIEFSCADYGSQTITVTADNATFKTSASGTAAASATVTATNGKITLDIAGGTMTSGVSAGSTRTITWTFSAGSTVIAKAYTVAYAPYTGTTGALGEAGNKGTGADAWIGSILWWQGITGVDTYLSTSNIKDLNITNQTPSDKQICVPNTGKFDPMLGVLYATDGTSNPLNWFTNVSSNGTFGFIKYSSNGTSWRTVYAYGATASLIADTSRYSDINQIPNVKCGFYLTDKEDVNANRDFYLTKYTNTLLMGCGASDDTNHEQANQSHEDYTYSSDKIYNGANSGAKVTTTTTYSNAGDLYRGTVSYAISGTNTYSFALHGYVQGHTSGKNYCYAANTLYAPIKITAIDKSSLRTLISTDVCSKSKYTEASWNAYQTALKSACEVLGNPTSTANSYSDLTTKINALQTTIYFNGNGGTASATSINVTVGSATTATVSAADVTATRTGYSFNGWSTSSTATSGTTSGNITGVEFGATLYATWTPAVYTVHYNANGGSGTMADSTHTYGTAANLTANAFTRTGYTFDGWIPPETTLINDTTEHFYDYATDPDHHDFKQYTITGPFNAGDQFELECDVKGKGELTNFFYGETGYLNVASVVNSDGVTSNSTDGNNKPIPSGTTLNDYKHYKVTFTLSSNGDGSLNKYVLFRAQPDSANLYVKNITFKKVKYGDKANVLNLTSVNGGSVEMKASWKPITYNITYTLNGGSVSTANPSTYNIETATFKLNNPTKTGYNFAGWTGTGLSSATETVSVAEGSTGDKSYTANWTAKTISLTLNDTTGGGGQGQVDNVTYNADMPTLTKLPFKPGYEFLGYYADLDTESTKYYKADGTSAQKWLRDDNTYQLLAKWSTTPITYSVSFNGNGSTGGSMSNQAFTYDTAQALTANAFERKFTVTFNGNSGTPAFSSSTATATFNGWEDRGEIRHANGVTYSYTEIDAPYYANNNSDLLDVFGYNKYGLVNHYVNYGIGEGRSPKGSTPGLYPDGATVKNMATTPNSVVPLYANWTDGSITLPTATRSGYTFNGWYTAAEGGTKVGDAGDSYTPTEGTTLYAHWTINTYTVTYNANGGSGAPGDQTKTYGTDLALSATEPTRTGYTFNGWNTASDGSGTDYAKGATYTANAAVTLYAKWTPIEYTITYTLDGGTNAAENPETYTVESSDITLEVPTKTGYTFKGWTLSGATFAYGSVTNGTAATKANIATGSYGNVTAVANWEIIKYLVKFDANGHGTAPAPTSADYNTTVTKPADPTATGYTFGGWYKEAGCTNAWDFDTDKVTADTTLYAKWTKNVYRVTFNANGHGTAPEHQDVEHGKYATAPTAPTAAGYTFGGWYKEAGCTNAWDFDRDTVTAATTLYAKWTKDSYTITYNGVDGATFEASNPTTYDVETAVTLNNPSKDGYDFLGWTEGDGNTLSSSVTIGNGSTGNKTYTANWIKTNITIDAIDSGSILESSKVSISSITAKNGANAKVAAALSNGKLSFTPKDMTWSAPEEFTVTLSNNATKTVQVFPQTTVLYEETVGEEYYVDDTLIDPLDPDSDAYVWKNKTSTVTGDTTNDAGVYGYSNAYNKLSKYSDGTAFETTVSAGDKTSTGKNIYPAYKFTFTGTGFDILSTCDKDSGLMFVDVYKEDSNGELQYVEKPNGKGYFGLGAINTHCSDPIYQEVVYREEGMPYGTYVVIATAIYDIAFDLTDKGLDQAGYDTVVPENGSIVDFSSIFDDGRISKYKYYSMDSESYRSGNDDIIDFEPVVVQAQNPTYNATDGSYNVTIDSVRIYNPGDTSNTELTKQYTNDNELNPTYRKLRDIYVEINDFDLGTMYVEGEEYSEENLKWAGYQKIENGSSNTELELRPSAVDGSDSYKAAIAFNVSGYDRIHVSLRAAQGIACTAIINGNPISINSTTEQYYDITDFIDDNGNVAIACTSDNPKAMLAVCGFKYFESMKPDSAGEETVIFEATDDALLNAQRMFASMKQPDAEEMTFTVDFGVAGTAATTVAADKFTVENIGGVWTAKAQLSADELSALFAEAENSKDCILDAENGITLTATYADGTWIPQTAEAKVYALAKLVAKTGSSTVIDGQFIYGLKTAMTKAEFKNSFVSVEGKATIEYSSNGKYLGTGTKVYLVNGGSRVAEYTIVIFGDTNGDGVYDGTDAVIVNCIAAGLAIDDAAVNMAADCNHDGVVDISDVNTLEHAGILLAGVDQTKSFDELLETNAAFVEYLSLIDQTVAPETKEDAEADDDNGTDSSTESVADESKTEDTTAKDGQLSWLKTLIKAVAKVLSFVVEKVSVLFKA